jgi:hypothetical protein
MRLPENIEKGDKITAAEYAKRRGIPVKVLTEPGRAIDLGLVRAELVPTGKRCIRLVDVAEADEDLAKLPRCPHEGCERPVFPPSLACNGPHTRGLEERGKTKSSEIRGKMAAGKRGKRRPDVRERVLALHADKKWRAEWGLSTMQGRAQGARTIAKTRDSIPGTTIRKWKNKKNSLDGGPKRKYNDEQEAWVLALRAQGVGFKRAARITGLSPAQTRAIFRLSNG